MPFVSNILSYIITYQLIMIVISYIENVFIC